MSNAQRKLQPDAGKVAAFCRRLLTYASVDEGRPSLNRTACRVAPGVWVACDGHRMAMLPSPILSDGSRWGDAASIGKVWRMDELELLCEGGVPTFAKRAPALVQWGATSPAGDTRAVDANFPAYNKVVPRRSTLPHTLAIDPVAVKGLLAAVKAPIGGDWTPAERIAAGGKLPKLGGKLDRGAAMLRLWADGGMTIDGELVTRDVLAPDTPGKVASERHTWGTPGEGEPIVGVNPHLLCDVGSVPFDLRYSDQFGPMLAVCNGEAHVIMPMRL